MNLATLNGNAPWNTSTAKENDFAPLPAGVYTVQVTKVTDKAIKNGTGTQACFELTVINNEQYKNRKIFNNINIILPSSPKAEEIGRNNLMLFAKACGIVNISDTNELYMKVCNVSIAIRDDEQYGKQNIVKSYAPATSASAMPNVQASPVNLNAPWS